MKGICTGLINSWHDLTFLLYLSHVNISLRVSGVFAFLWAYAIPLSRGLRSGFLRKQLRARVPSGLCGGLRGRRESQLLAAVLSIAPLLCFAWDVPDRCGNFQSWARLKLRCWKTSWMPFSQWCPLPAPGGVKYRLKTENDVSDFPHPVFNENKTSAYPLVLCLEGFMISSCGLILNAKCHLLVRFPTAFLSAYEN